MADKPPDLQCPDCGARLLLRDKPKVWGKGQIFMCEREPLGCGGKIGADRHGRPTGIPAPAPVRAARSKMTDKINEMAGNAFRLYDDIDLKDKKAMDAARWKNRSRIFRYLAFHLKMGKIKSIADIADIEQLREAWLLLDVGMERIRDWDKAGGNKRDQVPW